MFARRKNLKRVDLLDGVVGATIALLGFFVLSFFWQVGSGMAWSEEAFLAGIRKESEQRISRERQQIRFLLEEEDSGQEEAWKEGLEIARHLEGNSQFHLYLARGFRARNLPGRAIREYRKAVELNRDYTDKRSPFFLGKVLRPFVMKARGIYLRERRLRPDSEEVRQTVRDLFYLQRSLAGGCR